MKRLVAVGCVLSVFTGGCDILIGLTPPKTHKCEGGEVGKECKTGLVGECQIGLTMCEDELFACKAPAPMVESCDGKDNDCDGMVDNNISDAGMACDTGMHGPCAYGFEICSAGKPQCVVINAPQAEVCDGIDNDCDGKVDEDALGIGQSCTTGLLGVCAAGTYSCANGVLQCNAMMPGVEVCDGIDNNCDGMIDNGNPGGGASCVTGLPGVCADGTVTCSSGGLICTSSEFASAESCDGIDNDCDGVVDNGDPGGGTNCTTGALGVCAVGTTRCSAGSIVCDQKAQPIAELCDGLDNDCDGAVDENNPGVGMTCDTGLMGVCAAGTITACTAGQPVCQENSQPSIEQCNTMVVDENCDGIANCVGSHIISKQFAGVGTPATRMTIAADQDENIILAGTFKGSMSLGGAPLSYAGGTDIFLAKFDKQLGHLWSVRFGDAMDQVVTRVDVDATNNILVTGYFAGTVNFGGNSLTSAGNTDIYVAKFAPNGAHLWSKKFGDSASQWAYGLVTNAAGEVFVAGGNQGVVDFGCGPTQQASGYDVWFAKLSANGTCAWSSNVTASGNQMATDIAVDKNGYVVLTGWYSGSYTIGGNALTNTNTSDIFVAKFTPAGADSWGRGFGSSQTDTGTGVVTDGANNIIIAGDFEGSIAFGAKTLVSAGYSDGFLAKLDPSGNNIWSRAITGPQSQHPNDIAIDDADNLVLTGVTLGALDFGSGNVATCVGNPDIMTGKFDANGNPLWGKCWGDGYSQYGRGIAVDRLGNVMFTGDFLGTVDFGGGVMNGNYDIFLAKLTP